MNEGAYWQNKVKTKSESENALPVETSSSL